MSSGVGGNEQCGHGPVTKRVGEQGKVSTGGCQLGELSAWHVRHRHLRVLCPSH